MYKRYLLNCTTNNVGGAVQNSVNFIKHLHQNGLENDWYFFLSKEVYIQVENLLLDSYEVIDSPAKNFKARRFIRTRQKDLKPTLVYTTAGPAYVDFDCLHIMGCSNPYILGANSLSKKYLRSHFERIGRELHTLYQRFHIRKADKWLVQTEDSLNQLASLGIKKRDCSIIYNSISSDFKKSYEQSNKASTDTIDLDSVVRILVPSAYYKHKNLEIVPFVLGELTKRGVKAIITLTTSDSESIRNIYQQAKLLGVENRIVNIGPFEHSEAVTIYESHDLILQPSLLEVFSTSYIEAMALLKPLVVPDLNFSRGICENYPVYYQAGNAISCADSILSALRKQNNKELAGRLLSIYGDQESRFQNIMNVINDYKG
ncbi:hypothetical protein BCS99_04700 [Vibrio breoganii]|nr:glycosyltransferase [Vibrio breoganii]PML40666.1 hypothetical protein BCT77_00450 [Vibrio breoganii]PMO71036.1 hypothetical protein BCT02_02090 [Vibrio breoganii]PMO90478.1 hypothetical protein BCS99_04700 [Vibrio breoganii]